MRFRPDLPACDRIEDFSVPATRGGAEARESLHVGYSRRASAVLCSVPRSGAIGVLQHTAHRSAVAGVRFSHPFCR